MDQERIAIFFHRTEVDIGTTCNLICKKKIKTFFLFFV